MNTFLRSGARFSDCRAYRYTLWRVWDDEGPMLNVIGLNPSTADENVNDPTIRRCIDFGKRWGFGGLVMTNLFAYRSTDPHGLTTVADPVGPENDTTLKVQAYEAAYVIAAWGAHPLAVARSEAVKPLLARYHVMCLGTTKDGAPRHPLYLPKTTMPTAYWSDLQERLPAPEQPAEPWPPPSIEGEWLPLPGFADDEPRQDGGRKTWTA